MGNDIDIMSKDVEFENHYWKHYGPKDESTLSFFRRSFNTFCDSIASPKR